MLPVGSIHSEETLVKYGFKQKTNNESIDTSSDKQHVVACRYCQVLHVSAELIHETESEYTHAVIPPMLFLK